MPLLCQNAILKKTSLHLCNAHERKNTPQKKTHQKEPQKAASAVSKSQKAEYELSSQQFTVIFWYGRITY